MNCLYRYYAMNLVVIAGILPFVGLLQASPPRNVPEELRKEYTLGGVIPIRYRYYDNYYPPSKSRIYTREKIDEMMARERAGMLRYYGRTNTFMRNAFRKFSIRGKGVGVMGSDRPACESIVLC